MVLTHAHRAVIGLGLLTLAACSGSGSSAPDAPSVTSAVGVKQLLFNWGSVPGADLYRVKENPDGASGFSQTGADLTAGQTSYRVDVAVHRQDWQNARYLVEACNTHGCADSADISFAGSANAAIGYFKAANNGSGDHFGATMAVSADGNTLAVGAPQEGSGATGVNGDASLNNAASAGAVYIFTRNGVGTWTQQAYIKASNTEAGDLFGNAVTLSGDGTTLAVGAYKEDGPDSGINGTHQALNTATDAGAVYVFTRDGVGTWTQQAYVKASNTGAGDLFGNAVTLSGDGTTLAVGAYKEDGPDSGINGTHQALNTATDAGAVYVFTRDGVGTWTQQAYVKASNTGAGDLFGNAVTLSGDGTTLAVGAYKEDGPDSGINGTHQALNTATDAGAVYVFTRDGVGTWTQQAYVKASNTGAGEQIGYAVALSSSGGTLAAGAPYEDTSITDSGAVYLYTRDGTGVWSQQAMVKAANTGAGDNFGRALALDDGGDTLVVSAPGEDSAATGIGGDPADNSINGAGAAYVFTRDAADAWSQSTYLKATNPDTNDAFGISVAVNGDGGTVAVGADLEDGSATGIDGDESDNNSNAAGAAYLY